MKIKEMLYTLKKTDDNIKAKLVKSKSVSGTTDGNGYTSSGLTLNDVPLWVGDVYENGTLRGTVKPSFLVDTNMSRISVRFLSWEDTVLAKNANVTFTIYYISN